MFAVKLVIIVSLMADSYCMSRKCGALIDSECGDYDIAEIRWIKTTEDLRNFCSTFMTHGRCVDKVLERCVQDKDSDGIEEDRERFRQTLQFTEDFCKDDSPAFKAVSTNLNCILSTVNNMDDTCSFHMLNETHVEKFSKLVGENFSCVVDSFTYYCINAKFDIECGSDVRDAVGEILDKSGLMSPYCRPVRTELKYFEPEFKSELLRGNDGQAALPAVFELMSKQAD